LPGHDIVIGEGTVVYEPDISQPIQHGRRCRFGHPASRERAPEFGASPGTCGKQAQADRPGHVFGVGVRIGTPVIEFGRFSGRRARAATRRTQASHWC
jgi:hypothetical protein